MNEAQLEAGIEEILVPLGFAPSQSMLFCAATRDLVGPFPWVVGDDDEVDLDRDCTDLMVTLDGGLVREVTLEGADLGDVIGEVLGADAARRYCSAVPGPISQAGPELLDSLRNLFSGGL